MSDEMIFSQIRKIINELANNNNTFIQEHFDEDDLTVADQDASDKPDGFDKDAYYTQFKLMQQGLLRAEESLNFLSKKKNSLKKQITPEKYYKAKSKYNTLLTELNSAKRLSQSLIERKELHEASEQQRVVLKLASDCTKLKEKLEGWDADGTAPTNKKKHTDILLMKQSREQG